MNFDFEKIKKEELKKTENLKEKRSLILAIEKFRKNGLVPIITEIKRASPAVGKIREIETEKAALEMEAGGACAISVLTARQFSGNLGDLIKVKEMVKVPVLRKDFIFNEFQIDQSYFAGADVVLLIVSILKNKTKKFVEKIHRLGMEALVEIHSEKEIKFALESEARLIGINNRNLKTLKVDLATTERLIPKIPKARIIIAESGINKKEDLVRILKAGADAALIGTAIMKGENIKEKVKEFSTPKL